MRAALIISRPGIKKGGHQKLSLFLTVSALLLVGLSEVAVTAEPEIPEIPTQVVRFAHKPFLDHTQAIIGIQKGCQRSWDHN